MILSSSLFFFFFLFTLTTYSQTAGIITQINTFNAQYKYATIPTIDALVAFWWTPDPANNLLKVAVMGQATGYVAFGFNNASTDSDHMTNGYAVVSTNNTFVIYSLLSGRMARRADSSGISNGVMNIIDGYIFTSFDWLLKGSVSFNMNDEQVIIWSLKSSIGIGYHDLGQGWGTVNFNNPTDLHPPKINCSGCVYGSCPTGITFLGPCFCVSNYRSDTNCTVSAHKFNHTFLTADNKVIVNMFWTLSPSTGLRIDVQRPLNPTGDPNQWFAIGFSQPSGRMSNTDTVLYPDDDLDVSAFYINKEQTYSGLVPPYITIRNVTSAQVSGSSFFGFVRDLDDGRNALTNPTKVYMVAVAAYSAFKPNHGAHDLWSTGADVVDLETGIISEPEFVWTNPVTHGFLMWFCWCIIMPIGFISARFLRFVPDDRFHCALWFEAHRTVMSIGFIIIIISAVYIIAQTESHLDSTHKVLGVTVLVGALFQVMSAIMRPHATADGKKVSPQRFFFEWAHHSIGRITILIAWVTIPYGLVLVPGISMTIVYIHIVISICWLILGLILEIRKYILEKRTNPEHQRLK